MTLSVIVPVYNTEKGLSCCIESILGQSFADFELLLVDDGSNDGSASICDGYAEKDSRVRVFHKENGGASSARNAGIEKAQGQWITFIDSDDWIEQDYFTALSDSNEDYVYNHRVFSDGERDGVLPQGVYKDEDYCRFLVESSQSNLFRTSIGVFFKREILERFKIRFDKRIRFGEDRVFAMEYYTHCSSMKIVDGPHYIYNRCDNWHQKFVLTFREAELFMGAFMDVYERFPVKSTEIVSTAGIIVRFIDKNEKNLRLKQALSKAFLRYRKEFLGEKSAMFRVKYYVSKVISTFIHV